MSNRRVPLASNQNAANSPLRNPALKQKRTLTQLQREEPYGQPPPTKKLVLDAGTQRVVRSQPQPPPRVSKSAIPVQSRRSTNSTYDTKLARERAAARQQQDAAAVTEFTEKDIEEIQVWKAHHVARFPKSLFYFDQIPNDVAHRLKRQIAALGGRETAFFSTDVTHVITSRTIPTEDVSASDNSHNLATEKEAAQSEEERTETINPSLLTRFSNTTIKRTLFDADLRTRTHRPPPQLGDQALRPPKKMVDILIRAREMKKKIWTVDKLFRMMALLLEEDPYRSAEMAYGRRKYTVTQSESRGGEDRNLLRLLQKERANGPSDRDPTVLARELIYFKGPYIYVYDIEEKQKPIMVKQYVKIPGQAEEKWPQFQTAALGRCPFIEDSEVREAREAREARKAQEAEQKARAKGDGQEDAAGEKKPAPQAPKMAPPKPITRKRTLGEMELGDTRQSRVISSSFPTLSQRQGGESMDFSRKAFTSQAAAGRLLGGEPVASGLQRSNVTSAIRSQMISSTATTPGVITGLSKEVHGLQRQVLKWHTPAVSQDRSSRQTTGTSFHEGGSTSRPPTLGRTSSRKLETADGNPKEKEGAENPQSTKRTASRKKSRDRELKPGYCENCAEKYADFDEHIESQKHRAFANDEENWVELDDLLAQLERIPKRPSWKSTPSWSHSTDDEAY